MWSNKYKYKSLLCESLPKDNRGIRHLHIYCFRDQKCVLSTKKTHNMHATKILYELREMHYNLRMLYAISIITIRPWRCMCTIQYVHA